MQCVAVPLSHFCLHNKFASIIAFVGMGFVCSAKNVLNGILMELDLLTQVFCLTKLQICTTESHYRDTLKSGGYELYKKVE